MKHLFGSCMIAFSMYSRLPVPQVEWREESMKHAMCFFPLVGAVQGLLLGVWFFLSLQVFGFSLGMTALVGTALPIFVTGGIHMDGFLDTMDALHSYADRQKRLEILKDPHLGAFAVIYFAGYLLLYVGVLYESLNLALDSEQQMILYVLPMFFMTSERALSGLSVVCFPTAKKDGLAVTFAEAAKKRTDRRVLCLWPVFALILMKMFGGNALAVFSLAVFIIQLFVFAWYYRLSKKLFGGITGDLAGYFLQVCELASFFCLLLLLKTGCLPV